MEPSAKGGRISQAEKKGKTQPKSGKGVIGIVCKKRAGKDSQHAQGEITSRRGCWGGDYL